MKNIEAAIFDLDGTLIDSMSVWDDIDVIYLQGKGIEVPPNLKDEITHLSFSETAKYIKDKFAIEESVAEMMSLWHDMAIHHYSNTIPLKEGALEYLHFLKNNNIKIALATSNSQELLKAVLEQHNIYHLFDSITTTEEAKKSKDNPHVYLLAANKLNVAPSNCVVFEDILAAVKGAKKAGMYTVAVYDKSSEHHRNEITSLADKYIMNFFELLHEISI